MPKAPATKTAARKARAGGTAAKKTAAAQGSTRTPKRVAAKRAATTKSSTTATTAAKKPTAKKSTAKSTAKKSTAKKVTKKAAAKKTAAKKTAKAPTKKTAAKKTAKAPARKTAAKKTTAKKAPARKSAAKKTTATKTTAGKAPAKAAKAGGRKGRLAVRAGEKPWTAKELAEVRSALEAEHKRLRAEIDEAEEEIAVLFRDGGDGAGHDQADVGSSTFERDHEMSLANHSRELLSQVDRALARIEDGSYGNCESCGNPIGKLRLMAFPRATLCVTCKQRQERR